MSLTGTHGNVASIHHPHLAWPIRTRSRHSPSAVAADGRLLNSIVVPLDGGTFAEHAIPLATAIARRAGAVLKLVRVFTSAEKPTSFHRAIACDVMDAQRRTEARRYLEYVQHRVAGRAPDLTVVAQLVDATRVAEGLSRVSHGTDLVVMATHGRGLLGRLLLGSVSRELLQSRRQPTIFLRGYHSPVDFSADPATRHIAIALDGRKTSERALLAAGRLARVTGAMTTLLYVDDPNELDERFAHSSPEGYLRWTRSESMPTTLPVGTHVVRGAPDPVRGILSYVAESETDLIAVTNSEPHGLFGTTAERLIRNSQTPVMVVRE